MPKVEIMPLTRIIWRQGCEDKAQILNQLIKECQEAELLTVSHKLRNCATIQIPGDKFDEYYCDLSKKRLVFLPIRRVKPTNGFSHILHEAKPGELFDVYGVASHSLKKAEEFVGLSGSEGKLDHKKMGRLLGYPQCCIDFFAKYWPQEHYDPIFLEARRTKGAKMIKNNVVKVKAIPEANVALRYFGPRAVPHLPCSFSCKKSQEFSQMFLQFNRSRDLLLEMLSTPFEWNGFKGVAIIDTKWFQGVVNSMSWEDDKPRVVKFV